MDNCRHTAMHKCTGLASACLGCVCCAREWQLSLVREQLANGWWARIWFGLVKEKVMSLCPCESSCTFIVRTGCSCQAELNASKENDIYAWMIIVVTVKKCRLKVTTRIIMYMVRLAPRSSHWSRKCMYPSTILRTSIHANKHTRHHINAHISIYLQYIYIYI